ncbi:MAG: TraR/DksA C4-type zinc finger protein [Actinomycetota bacterium]|nr:TraR/DksA C4-type zinc finger protein [Actinomycetota bacterium]MDQ2957913.1 TraR/DksA C4-type zinc finger protein [Actinomycetota bacterium]
MTTRFIPNARGSTQLAELTQLTEEHAMENFRRALHEQRQFRIEQLRELAGTAGPTTGRPTDDTTGPLREVAAELRSGALTALAEVDAALERLALGTYGRCQRCSKEIARERLEIVPMAALCMDCQRDAETPDPGVPAAIS